jgi:hypothetical protein
LPGTFQGTACPEHNSTPVTVAVLTAHVSDARARRKARRQIYAEWLATEGQVSATVPVWWSRRTWIAAVCRWAATEEGVAALKAHNISIEMFRAVVTAIARYAEGRTGRNVAVTKERIAQDVKKALGKGSARTVTKVRNQILAAFGWAMEAKRGEGQPGGIHNRPSIWHLLSRAVGTLSRSVNLHEIKTPVTTNSPSAERRRKSSSTTATPAAATTTAAAPRRDRHTLMLAGHLAGKCQGFGKVHPGRLADVLQASHLDLPRWSIKELLSALDAQSAARHFSWPDRVSNAAGFLAHRIAALPAAPEVLAPTPIPAPFVSQPRTAPATPETRAAGIALVRAAVITNRRRAAAA